ncbi:thermonuclease family protein [Leptolyngbya sp. FACHB-17]|uniref:thermonuclease family protein n=1 Tax=unclassified Leptolyngbya TaxID=2650499 RepID=UPI00168045B6|nr:thermonuclease family protein [Leptolyngbya sp. FACHB-17]MBD2078458.1 thermonuclease family protein [Leptolyngbya sp. FACHB-17]
MNSLPLVAIAVLGVMAWNKQQDSANARVDYDQANSNYVSRPNADRSSKHLKADRVLDGDTIKLANGEMVRLCGIDAPEKSQPLGMESKAKLQQLIQQAGNDVILVETERDRFGRIVGDLFVRNKASRNPDEEFFVNGEMVRSGMAYHYARYSRNCSDQQALETSEGLAKSKKLGVWKGNHEKPWDFQRRQRGK